MQIFSSFLVQYLHVLPPLTAEDNRLEVEVEGEEVTACSDVERDEAVSMNELQGGGVMGKLRAHGGCVVSWAGGKNVERSSELNLLKNMSSSLALSRLPSGCSLFILKLMIFSYS